MAFFIKALVTGFGFGYIPIAPGTFGTLAAGLIYWFVFPENIYINIAIILFVLLISIPLTNKAEKILAAKDDQRIVIDEFVGFWISLLFLPRTFKILLTAFVLFRFFDVYKPLFIKKVESWKGGVGVMADDVLAGIMANIFLHIFYYIQKLG